MTLPAAFQTRPIAHRALHDRSDGRPENSRAAIRAAIARGYGIEIDLQLSADGQAMVFHDYALDRLTSARGAIRDRTAEALGAIALTGGDEGIPTLAEVLAITAGQVPLLVEIKDQDGAMGPDVGPLEQATARSDEQLAYYVEQAREVIDLSMTSQKDVLEALGAVRQQSATNGNGAG